MQQESTICIRFRVRRKTLTRWQCNCLLCNRRRQQLQASRYCRGLKRENCACFSFPGAAVHLYASRNDESAGHNTKCSWLFPLWTNNWQINSEFQEDIVIYLNRWNANFDKVHPILAVLQYAEFIFPKKKCEIFINVISSLCSFIHMGKIAVSQDSIKTILISSILQTLQYYDHHYLCAAIFDDLWMPLCELEPLYIENLQNSTQSNLKSSLTKHYSPDGIGKRN